ncbi:MAG: hypothetical protein HY678_12460 [Chloroflexi bacterium]|nr:hypothetical protein [Chloroflexota bacterium]
MCAASPPVGGIDPADGTYAPVGGRNWPAGGGFDPVDAGYGPCGGTKL